MHVRSFTLDVADSLFPAYTLCCYFRPPVVINPRCLLTRIVSSRHVFNTASVNFYLCKFISTFFFIFRLHSLTPKNHYCVSNMNFFFQFSHFCHWRYFFTVCCSSSLLKWLNFQKFENFINWHLWVSNFYTLFGKL